MESGLQVEEEDIYKDNIIDHYKNPRNKKVLPEYSLSQKEHNPLCGDEITLFIALEKENVKDVSFQSSGCVISQASASLLTEHLKGKSIVEAQNMAPNVIFGLLGISLNPLRQKCALLSLRALQRGIEEYHARN